MNLKDKLKEANFGDYDKGIPRVSNLISFLYPFEGNNKKRYLDWLASKEIEEKDYLSGAQELGTLVHEGLENFLLKRDIEYTDEVKIEIDHGIEYLNSLGYKEILTEVFLKDLQNRFNGTCDLLYIDKEGKIVLGDFKTYGIVKKRYGLPNKFTVPPDKRKKVQLQLSIYAYILNQIGIKVDRLELIFVHTEGVKVFEFEPVADSELEELFSSYQDSLEFKTF